MSLSRMPAVVGAVFALGSLGLLAGCGDDQAAPPSPSASSSAPASSPATPSPTSSTEPGGDQSALIYFVGTTPQGPALFAEAAYDISADDTISRLLDGPADPDYSSLIPGDSLGPAVNFDGIGNDGRFSLDLTDASWEQRPASMTKKQARLAVQQLAWTLNTLQGADGFDPATRSTSALTFYRDGQEVSYLGIPSGVKPKPDIDTLALVNVIAPADGAVVKDNLTASGLANSFEATVPWRIVDSAGKVVLEDSAMAEGTMDRLYPWTAEIDISKLAPGDYTFIAATDDPSGGEGGGPTEDTKQITVQ